MPQNFIECDRAQLLLMSLSPREWLPENHLARFVIDAVKDIDLSPFYARFREDGWGRAAYDPAMMAAIALHAYAKWQRSSRGIERACAEDIAYRLSAVARLVGKLGPTLRAVVLAPDQLVDGDAPRDVADARQEGDAHERQAQDDHDQDDLQIAVGR